MKWKGIPDSKAKKFFATFFWEDYKDWKETVSEVLLMDTQEMIEIIQGIDEDYDFSFTESYEEIAGSIQQWTQSLNLAPPSPGRGTDA